MPCPMMAGNWKMHKTTTEATALAAAVVARLADRPAADDEMAVDVVLAPPFTALAPVAEATADSGVALAAQDMHWADAGAFTGAISPRMVAELARYVILGHSERRALFGETNDDVNRKVHAALAHGLRPIVCVGETAGAREDGQTDAVVIGQLEAALDGVAADELERLTVAYEPVWAIGSGEACAPDEAGRVAALLRARLTARRPSDGARVLYGGSVKPGNVAGYLARPEIDGALVGGASLEADSFVALVASAGRHIGQEDGANG